MENQVLLELSFWTISRKVKRNSLFWALLASGQTRISPRNWDLPLSSCAQVSWLCAQGELGCRGLLMVLGELLGVIPQRVCGLRGIINMGRAQCPTSYRANMINIRNLILILWCEVSHNSHRQRIPRRKAEERPTTRNNFSLINLVLCVGLDIPISTRHCIIIIGIISNESPCAPVFKI